MIRLKSSLLRYTGFDRPADSADFDVFVRIVDHADDLFQGPAGVENDVVAYEDTGYNNDDDREAADWEAAKAFFLGLVFHDVDRPFVNRGNYGRLRTSCPLYFWQRFGTPARAGNFRGSTYRES